MKARKLLQRDWDQLLIVAAGFLPQTGGDLVRAMSKAIAAHAELVEAVRHGRVGAELPRGTVRLVVPDEGGLALEYTPKTRGDSHPPPDITIDGIPDE
ncbi:MAG: hypothetical protein R3F59_29075 [Myxococcota bacterium]